jgi:hypothetical protein
MAYEAAALRVLGIEACVLAALDQVGEHRLVGEGQF